jgi:hypothetical protein
MSVGKTTSYAQHWTKYQVFKQRISQKIAESIISGTNSYFGIIRVANWKTMAKRTMSDTNAALSYTLGALFTVVALASFIELIYAIYNTVRTATFKANYIYIVAIYAFTQSK